MCVCVITRGMSVCVRWNWQEVFVSNVQRSISEFYVHSHERGFIEKCEIKIKKTIKKWNGWDSREREPGSNIHCENKHSDTKT